LLRVGLQAITFLVLARLLKPDDFGAAALATVAVNFVVLVGQVAIEPAIVRAKSLSPQMLSTLYFGVLILDCLLALLLMAGGAYLFHLSGSRDAFILSSLTGVGLLGWAIGSVHRGLLLKAGDYRQLMHAGVLGSLVNAVLAPCLAVAGFGAAAVSAGQVGAILTTSLVCIRASGWRPERLFDWRAVRAELRFTRDLAAFNVANFAARNVDTVLIAIALGVKSAGIYDRAYVLLVYVGAMGGMVVGRVIFPRLARMHSNDLALDQEFYRGVRLLVGLCSPIYVFLILYAQPLVTVLFGADFGDLAVVLQVLSLAGILLLPQSATGALLQASGQTRRYAIIGWATAITYVLATVVGLALGSLLTVAGAIAANAFLCLIPVLWWSSSHSDLKLSGMLYATVQGLVPALALLVSGLAITRVLQPIVQLGDVGLVVFGSVISALCLVPWSVRTWRRL
jgi:PST family polysaccharide transporter